MPSQLVETPMGGGLQQRTAEAHIPFGELTIAKNVRQNKNGMIEKRPGNAKLTNQIAIDPNFGSGTQTVDVTLGGALSAPKGELALTTNAGMSSYSTAWAAFGIPQPASEALVTRQETSITPVILSHTVIAQKMPPAIITDGTYYFYCTVSSGGTTYVTIEEIATGSIVQDKVQPDLGATNHLWAVPLLLGTAFVVVWQDTSQNIKMATMPAPYTGSFSGVSATLRTDAKATFCPHDCVVFGTDFTLAYADNAGNLKWHNYHATGVQFASATKAPTHSPRDIRLSLSGGTLYTAHAYDTAAFACLLNGKTWSTLFDKTGAAVVVEATSTFQISVLGISATRCVVAYSGTNTGTYTAAALVDVSTGTLIIDGTSNRLNHSLLLSKPFQQGSKYYFWVQAYTDATSFTATEYAIKNPSQWTNVLVDSRLDVGTTGTDWPSRPIAVDAPRFALPLQSRATTDYPDRSSPLSVVQPSANKWVAMTGIRQTAIASSWARITADFAATNRWRSSTLGTLSLQSSGMVTNWDGLRAFEQGFLSHVINVTTSQTVGTGLTASSTYYYRVVPVGFDAAGNIHRGIPSPLFSQATPSATNLQITLVIASQQLTDRSPLTVPTSTVVKYPLYWEIYRSQPTPGSAGTDVATNFVDVVVNNFQANTVTYVDAMGDTAIAPNALCYTFGGALPNGCPPGALDLCAHQGRAWIIDDTGSTLYFSKQIVDGEAVNFTDSFTMPLDDQAIALASMDDKLVVFTKRRIYYLVGLGPADNGSQNDYSGFVRIQSNVGCVDRRSVVSTADGVYFQSPIGIYLLDRGLNVIFIGQPVSDELTAYPTIVNATLHASQPWVYFYVTKANSSAGERLVYDYRVQKWYTDTLPSVPLSATNTDDGTHYWLDTTGQVWSESVITGNESVDSYTDEGAYVSMDVEIAPQHAAGVDGWQNLSRMQLLFYNATAHDLTIQTRPSYGTGYDTSQSFASAAIAAMQPFNHVATGVSCVEITPASSKLNGVSVRITDAAPANTDDPLSCRGPRLFALAFETEDLKAMANVDDSQRGQQA